MVKMKDSGVEWIGVIPSNWEIKKVKHLFFNKKYIPGILSKKYQRLALTLSGVVIRNKDDSEGLQPKDFVNYQLINEGNLVFKLIDLQNISTSRVGLSHYTGLVSPAYIILQKLKSSFVNVQFAEYFFLMMWHRAIFNSLGDDGVRSNLNVGDLLNIPICIPSILVQNKISDFLDKKCAEIDSLSEDIQKEIDLLEEYKKSVISEAVTKGLNPDVEMKDSGVEYIGTYPSLWTLKKLKYTFKERNERSLTGSELLLSVSQYKGVIPSSENSMRTMQPNSLIGYKKVYKDDLVFNKLNPTLARFGKSEYEGITSPEFSIYIIDSNQLYPKFLEYILRTEKYSKEYGRITLGVGDGYTRLYTNQLGNVYVAVPSLVEQEQILLFLKSIIDEIDKTLSEKKEQLTTLAEYKKSLIYEYVTGKKEVI